MTVKDVAAALIGICATAGLAALAVLEQQAHEPFSEPGSLTAIAMASVAYFYSRATAEATQQAQVRSTETVRQTQNGGVKAPGGQQ